MPPEQARFIAAAAYTLARAANADLEISDDETHAIEQALQSKGSIDEATAVLVTEMAKLQSQTVGATEDYVVTREFRNLASEAQRLDVLRACYAISAANGTISAEETVVVNEIARELDLEPADVNAVRAEFHDQLSAVQEVRRLAGGLTARSSSARASGRRQLASKASIVSTTRSISAIPITSGGLILSVSWPGPSVASRMPRASAPSTRSAASSVAGSRVARSATRTTPMNSPWPRTSPIDA